MGAYSNLSNVKFAAPAYFVNVRLIPEHIRSCGAVKSCGVPTDELHFSEMWYHGKLAGGRDEAEALLQRYSYLGDGTFLVRYSHTFIGDYSLSFCILCQYSSATIIIGAPCVCRAWQPVKVENMILGVEEDLKPIHFRMWIWRVNPRYPFGLRFTVDGRSGTQPSPGSIGL
ncbi:hypothetical protein B566_EDAN018590 [Ephemera danica]|nr:hypothetical protein B566_EDAN018590 [Ephemera danica]